MKWHIGFYLNKTDMNKRIKVIESKVLKSIYLYLAQNKVTLYYKATVRQVETQEENINCFTHCCLECKVFMMNKTKYYVKLKTE